MVKVSLKGFKTVAFKVNSLSITKGGTLTKEMPLVSKDVWQGEGLPTKTFVHIKSRAPWLTQAVMGKSCRGDMHEGVLTELRQRVEAEEQRIRSGSPPENSPDNEGTDPMDEMDVMEEPEAIHPETNEQKKKKDKHALRSIARYADSK